MVDKQPDETYSDEEAARRRDAVVRRMIATPPAPRNPSASRPKKRAAKRGTKVNRGR